MHDTLAKIYGGGGPLRGVSYALFEGNPRFIAAVGLRFESASAVFRAVPDDDTLDAGFWALAPEPDESLVEVGDTAPWSACIGSGVRWAWRLTNQQGYSDGVRLEFDEADEASRTIIELVEEASAIQIFLADPGAAA